MELNEKMAALEAENTDLRKKLSKSEGARQAAHIFLDDAKEHCRNEVQNLRHKLSGYINKVANLEQKLEQKLPKIPIDYSKAGSGEPPFDGKIYILHTCTWYKKEENKFIVSGLWDGDEWIAHDFMINDDVTHYTPLPEFEEKERLIMNTKTQNYDVNVITTMFKELQYCIHKQNKEMGWWDNPREDGTLLCLIHSEISEAMEGNRKNLMDDHLPYRKMEEVELADAVIRILDYAQAKGYDIGTALLEKVEYNRTRPDHKKENRSKDGGKKY